MFKQSISALVIALLCSTTTAKKKLNSKLQETLNADWEANKDKLYNTQNLLTLENQELQQKIIILEDAQEDTELAEEIENLKSQIEETLMQNEALQDTMDDQLSQSEAETQSFSEKAKIHQLDVENLTDEINQLKIITAQNEIDLEELKTALDLEQINDQQLTELMTKEIENLTNEKDQALMNESAQSVQLETMQDTQEKNKLNIQQQAQQLLALKSALNDALAEDEQLVASIVQTINQSKKESALFSLQSKEQSQNEENISNNFQNQISQLQNQIDDSKTKTNAAEQKISELQMLVSSSQSELDNANSDLVNLISQVDFDQVEIARLEREVIPPQHDINRWDLNDVSMSKVAIVTFI